MAVSINIPKETEEALRAEWGDLDQAARDALLIESYRAGKISLGLLAQTLGISVIAADKWLAERGVALTYSVQDLDDDRKTLAELSGAERS